jgi:hypothetical protein
MLTPSNCRFISVARVILHNTTGEISLRMTFAHRGRTASIRTAAMVLTLVDNYRTFVVGFYSTSKPRSR